MISNDVRLLIEVLIAFVVIVALIVLMARAIVAAWFHSPNVIAKTIATMNRLSDRVDRLERDRERDHETMMQLRVQVEEWMAYGRMLAAMLRRLDQDVPAPPASRLPVTQADQVDDRAVTQVIAALFDEAEIDDLVFQLGIKDGEIGGGTKSSKARNLVNYARRHGMTEELIALAQRLRPEGKFI